MNPLLIRRRGMMKAQQGGLPYDAEVEYIGSSGTQYIDTGYYPTQSSDLDIVVLNFGTGQTTGKYLMGAGKAPFSDPTGWAMGIAGSSGYVAWNNKKFFITPVTYNNLGIVKNTAYKLQINDSGVFVNDVLKVTLNNHSAVSNRNDSFWLFRLSNGTSSYNNGSWKFGRTTIKDNGVTVVDFVPCRIGTTGYMYDRVSGQLFGNAGTGDFILGPDVQ